MGTNYYLRSRRPVRTVVTHEGDEHGPVVRVEPEHAEAHLCKLSLGWNPVMACDPESTIPGARFTSLRGMMRFIRAHTGEYMIRSEYASGGSEETGWTYDEISPDDFEELVRTWGDGYRKRTGREPASHLPHGDIADDEGFEFCHVSFS